MPLPSCIIIEDSSPSPDLERARAHCRELEAGNILMLRSPPFALPAEDRDLLTAQRVSKSAIHKNISYRPATDQLRGFSNGASRERIHDVMRRYSAAVTDFVQRFLAPYAGRCSLDYASFRPLEEEGRALPLHKRNDLLHVDAFPSRPTRGRRILRVFTNIHASKLRVWITAETFPGLSRRFAVEAGLREHTSAWRSLCGKLARVAGAPDRSPYDRFMLHFHDWLKENHGFQNGEKKRFEFPPLASWLVFTDGCPHAVLSGQYALEQTFIVPLDALVAPELAPLRILESLAGKKLA